jgi:hypothetical protein
MQRRAKERVKKVKRKDWVKKKNGERKCVKEKRNLDRKDWQVRKHDKIEKMRH